MFEMVSYVIKTSMCYTKMAPIHSLQYAKVSPLALSIISAGRLQDVLNVTAAAEPSLSTISFFLTFGH